MATEQTRREARLDGVWERDGRNPAVGAVVLVLFLGSGYFLVQALSQIGFAAGDALLGGEISAERLRNVYRPVILAILAATQYGLLLVVSLAVIRRWHTKDLVAYLRLERVPWLGVLAGAIGGLGLVPVAERVARYLYDLLPELRRLLDATAFLSEARGPVELVAVFAVLAVTPAVCEELVFRAYLQRTLERRMKAPWHYLLTGVFFALFHQQVLTLPSLLLVGVFLSYLYFAFSSPYPAVVAHLVFNGSQVLLANAEAPPGVTPEGFAWSVVLGGLALSVVSIAVSLRARR